MMLEILIGVVSILITIYIWLTWDFDYWKKRGVLYVKPKFLFGNMKDIMLMRKHTSEVYTEIYRQYPDEPAVGIFKMSSPQLLLRDIDLMKTTFVKEFNSFHDNGMGESFDEPLFATNPFVATGEKWKALRSFHAHNQSSGKVKGMFPLMLDVCKDMSQYIKEKNGEPIEAKYFSGQYTTDVVASCAFGLKSNSFIDPNSEFRRMSAKIFQNSWYSNLVFVLMSLAPKLKNLLRLRVVSNEVTRFLVKVVGDMCKYRLENNVSRNDFLQTMLDENKNSEKPKYSDLDIAAHTMTFFADGYETSSALMCFVIYLLGLYPEYQEKIREELNEEGGINYENIHKYKYLDAVINETLRLYPPGFVLTRLCTQDITLKSGDKIYPLTKGVTISVPIVATHRDPNHFTDPDEFNPERFYEQKPSPYFLPFGLGPRACLGSRFALTQVKTGLAFLLKHFRIHPKHSDGTLPSYDKSSFLLAPPASGLWVTFEEIRED